MARDAGWGGGVEGGRCATPHCASSGGGLVWLLGRPRRAPHARTDGRAPRQRVLLLFDELFSVLFLPRCCCTCVGGFPPAEKSACGGPGAFATPLTHAAGCSVSVEGAVSGTLHGRQVCPGFAAVCRLCVPPVCFLFARSRGCSAECVHGCHGGGGAHRSVVGGPGGCPRVSNARLRAQRVVSTRSLAPVWPVFVPRLPVCVPKSPEEVPAGRTY